MTMWQVSIPGSGTHGVSTPHGQQFINLMHGGLLPYSQPLWTNDLQSTATKRRKIVHDNWFRQKNHLKDTLTVK